MKKIYLSLLLLAPGFVFADDASVVEQETIEQKDDTTIDESQEVTPEKKIEEDKDRAMFELDDDDFFGDSLDKMIEMGAVDEEAEVKPVPVWKAWLLRISSSTLAKLEALKTFIAKRYNDAKYMVAVAWAKARGKKVPKRPRVKKKKKRSNKKEKRTLALQQAQGER